MEPLKRYSLATIPALDKIEQDAPCLKLEDLLLVAKKMAGASFRNNRIYYEAAAMNVEDVESVAYIFAYLYMKKSNNCFGISTFMHDLVCHQLRIVHDLQQEFNAISVLANYPGEVRYSLALNRIFGV
jgi:hypothetical protein